MTIELPKGLRFVPSGHGRLSGVTVTGARIKALRLSQGHLVIVLRKPVVGLRVEIKSNSLSESPGLKAAAAHPQTLWLTVIAENTRARRTVLHVRVIGQMSAPS